MVLPLLYAGVMVVTTAGRIAIPIVARYIIKHGSKKAAQKYGTKIVSNTKIVKQVKQIKNISTKTKVNPRLKVSPGVKSFDKSVKKLTKEVNKFGKKTKVKTKPKVEMKNISAKQKNIAKKIAEKNQKRLDKVNPRKKIQAKKTTDTKLASPKTTKAKPSRTDLIKKVDKKSIATKADKTVKPVKGKPVKPKVDKKSIATKSKTSKVKDTKSSKTVKPVKGKPVKPKVDKKTSVKTKPKVDKKSLATKSKTSKVKDTKSSKVKDTKKVSKKVDKKSLATKSKTSKVKTKKPPNIPLIVGGTVAGGLIATALYNKKKNKKAPKFSDIKPKIKPKPYPKDDDFDKDSSSYEKGSAAPKKETDRSQYQTAKPSATFESRVRALVRQKGELTKQQVSGDRRNEYQIRIHKLKKENPKEFKKMFKLGGFGNLKD